MSNQRKPEHQSRQQLSFSFDLAPEPAPSRPVEPPVREADDPAPAVKARQEPATPAPEAPARLTRDACMQDLLQLVLADEDLPERRRRDLASSLRKFVEYLGTDLSSAANFHTYREQLRRFSPAGARVSDRRWANIRSDVAFALNRYGARRDAGRQSDLLPAWRALYEATQKPRLLRGLSRLRHWCSRQGIAPKAVDDAVLQSFHEHLKSGTFEKRPNRIYRDTCKLWNEAAVAVPGWPQRELSVPGFRKLVSLPVDSFPGSFGKALEDYRRLRLGQDLTAADRYDHRASPATINRQIRALLHLASAMVREGRPRTEIVDLACLFDAPWFETAVQSEFDRLEGRTRSLQNTAGTLHAVARHHLRLPQQRLEQIARIKRRLRSPVRGFTEKNRERLRQFADRRNREAFLRFVDTMMGLAGKATSAKKQHLAIQTALMHAILLSAPMRLANLTALNLQRHFRFSGPGRKGRVLLVLQAAEVKNNQPLEFELPTPTAELLRRYLAEARPVLLNGPDEGWLFPGEAPGSRKSDVTISGQLCSALKKHTGLIINPHLYRHLAAFFYLQARPNDYETVRQLLGHTTLQTTTMFYADIDRLCASRQYNEQVLEQQLRNSERQRPQKARRMSARQVPELRP